MLLPSASTGELSVKGRQIEILDFGALNRYIGTNLVQK